MTSDASYVAAVPIDGWACSDGAIWRLWTVAYDDAPTNGLPRNAGWLSLADDAVPSHGLLPDPTSATANDGTTTIDDGPATVHANDASTDAGTHGSCSEADSQKRCPRFSRQVDLGLHRR